MCATLKEPLMQTHDHPNRFQRFRARRKAQGMKELRLWVPDPDRPGFAADVERQVALLRKAPEERDALEFIEKTTDWDT